MIHANDQAKPRRVLVVLGSVRRGRICPQVVDWVIAAAPELPDAALEVVDLADWPLPMTDEPGVPARDVYLQPHTLAWSRKVAAASGFVFVTPQYNWGYPAALKNALDHLYKEWSGKPAVIVSYGFHGGGKCAAQLRQVLEGLHMRPIATMPALTLAHEMLAADGRLADPARDLASAAPSVERAIGELAALLAA